MYINVKCHEICDFLRILMHVVSFLDVFDVYQYVSITT